MWRAKDRLYFLPQVFGEFALMHPFESCDSSEGDKLYPKKRTMEDRVHDAFEMFREWKSDKRIDKYTIAPDRFNAGYDKGFKEWLKKDIQNVSFQTPRIFRSITDREAKAVAKLQEVNEEAKKVYAMFVEKQDTLERVTQEAEILRRGYDHSDT